MREAERRGWHAAAAECRLRLGRELCDLRCHLDSVNIELRDVSSPSFASAREIYEDLVALENEFPALRIDLKAREVAVTTEPITLEGVSLGRFEIVIEWPLGGGALAYRVVALSPNPSARNEDVTHPHVNEDTLCEGEGRAAIRLCLAAGRLWDFFAVVARTLATYNASSAYVALEEWGGRCCSRCGDAPGNEDLSSCDRCECDVCDECNVTCGACGRCLCDDCVAPCRGCGDQFCGACLQNCPTCDDHLCEECLDHDNCHRCRDAATPQNPSHDFPAEPAADGAEALGLGLGEAGVPA